MKLKLTAILALLFLVLPRTAEADERAETIRTNCVELMRMGLCGALRPVSDYSEDALAAPYIMYGIGTVTFREYLAVRGLATPDPADTRMCDVAAAACRADWNSPSCMVGRSLWLRR